MTLRNCSYEKDVARALKDGHWPEGCDRELRAHVEDCTNCSDLVLLTEAFQRARHESVRETPSGSASLLWWRAQLRRRNAAAETVSRPITIAQTFALTINLLVAAVFVASQYRHGLRWASWWTDVAPSRAFHLFAIESSKLDWHLPLLIPSLGGLAVLSGIVVYLASEKL